MTTKQAPGHARRMAALAWLSFYSGLPLGLHVSTVGVWLQDRGLPLQEIGLFSLIGLPWSFKWVWSPLVDRFSIPLFDRRRGWMVAGQAALLLALAGLALGERSTSVAAIAIVLWCVTFASATYDIAIDAYAVEVMDPAEHGRGNGIRVAAYRVAMLVAGGLAIWMSDYVPWRTVFAGLAMLYVLALLLAPAVPAPRNPSAPPRDLTRAIIGPLKDLLSRPRVIELLLFVFFYKFSDNVAGTMFFPFLRQHGYTGKQIGLASKTIGLAATLIGTLTGGFAISAMGLLRSLWIFGALGGASTIAYGVCSLRPEVRGLAYGAFAVENFMTALATTALLAFLTRVTARRYSATQYALLSSLFALGRQGAGAISGYLAHWLGFTLFFFSSSLLCIPALVLLARLGPAHLEGPPAESPDASQP